MAKIKTQDEIVQELFEVVKKKKAEIAKAEKPTWLTNCSFPFEEGSANKLNLNTVTQSGTLVSVLGTLIAKKEAHESAEKILGTKQPFRWAGFTYNDWETDIKTRLNKIEIGKRKAELESYEERLDKLISPELKARMELADLQKSLS